MATTVQCPAVNGMMCHSSIVLIVLVIMAANSNLLKNIDPDIALIIKK